MSLAARGAAAVTLGVLSLTGCAADAPSDATPPVTTTPASPTPTSEGVAAPGTATLAPPGLTTSPGSSAPPPATGSAPTNPPAPAELDAGSAPPPTKRCVAPEGVSASPRSIEQVVELINALPFPVTIECLLESLERPLDAYATKSFVSAQPAEGDANPRVFLLMGDSLTISVVPTGVGSEVVEFGEYTSDTESIKGELLFPVTEEVGLSAPFTKILSERGGTVCGLCHTGETEYPHPRFDHAFESVAIRPNPIYDVPLQDVFAEYQACDVELEPERCSILRGLFAHGEVRFRDFPEDLVIFF